MTRTEQTKYRAALEAMIAELSEALRGKGRIVIERSAEEVEETVMAAQREIAVVNLDRSSRLLREAKAALARMDEGSYGVCQSCDDPIKPRRLDAIPWASRCVPCQERAEHAEPLAA